MTVTAAPSSASRRPAAWTGSLPISTTVVPSSRAVSGVSATVHTYHLAGDVAGLVANEKGAGGGDVVGPSDPPHRRARHCILDSLSQVTGALGRPQHRRVYEARRNDVDGDADRRPSADLGRRCFCRLAVAVEYGDGRAVERQAFADRQPDPRSTTGDNRSALVTHDSRCDDGLPGCPDAVHEQLPQLLGRVTVVRVVSGPADRGGEGIEHDHL